MLLRLPKRGTLNIHPSLLPRWRGAAPIERAILAGDTQTGATIMQMDCGLDSGAILLQEKIPLLGDAGEMRSKLADLGAALLSRALRELPDLSPRPQNDADATYAAKIDKSDTAIRWDDSAAQIARQVRAFSPTPGAHTVFSFNNNDDKSGERIKIFAAHPAPSNSDNKNREPGEIIGVGKDGVVIACGENDALVATKLQRAGGRILNAAEFCRGYKQIAIGHKFAKPPREEASPPLPKSAAGTPSDSPPSKAPKFRIRGRA
jgi:methionyl-tRNA formyltransferase